MRKTKLLVPILVLIVSLSLKSDTSKKVNSAAFDKLLQLILSHDVSELTVAEVSADHTSVVVDAREKAEYDISHLPNAIWVGHDDFDIKRLAKVSKDEKIVVYCTLGYRSEKIAKKLLANGFTNVSNLYGGIFEWVNQDKIVCNSTGETKKVHAFNRVWSIWLNKGKKVY